jgi:hypothetical protein
VSIRSVGLSHVAMSVGPGTLTEQFRVDVLSFYGDLFGWREMESLRLDDRMTIAVGGATYVNVRERADAMTCSGYEHFGVVMPTPESVEAVWNQLNDRGIEVSAVQRGDDGYRSCKFQHLLPLSVEVQHFPSAT